MPLGVNSSLSKVAIISFIDGCPSVVRSAAVLLLSMGVSWLDIWTPFYIPAQGFYLIPIALAAWFCGHFTLTVVVGMSLLSNGYVAYENLASHESRWWEYGIGFASIGVLIFLFTIVVMRLHRLVTRLDWAASTDKLTGVRSRAGFMDVSAYEVGRARRSNTLVTIAIIDLDGFKAINDRYGHAMGDALLASVGQCLRDNLREIDVCGRIGGDEFAILIPELPLHEAQRVLERIHGLLQKITVVEGVTVNASIGSVTTSINDEIDLSNLLAQADRTMYEVKKTSKNKVVSVGK